jgi:hypothetical protein
MTISRNLAQHAQYIDTAGSLLPIAISDRINTSTGFFDLPTGTTAQRPSSPNNGYIRFNTTLGTLEIYSGGQWNSLATTSLVDPISAFLLMGA